MASCSPALREWPSRAQALRAWPSRAAISRVAISRVAIWRGAAAMEPLAKRFREALRRGSSGLAARQLFPHHPGKAHSGITAS